MASPTATTTAAENDVPNAHGGDDGPQNVGPTAPTAGDAHVADVRSLLEKSRYGVWCH